MCMRAYVNGYAYACSYCTRYSFMFARSRISRPVMGVIIRRSNSCQNSRDMLLLSLTWAAIGECCFECSCVQCARVRTLSPISESVSDGAPARAAVNSCSRSNRAFRRGWCVWFRDWRQVSKHIDLAAVAQLCLHALVIGNSKSSSVLYRFVQGIYAPIPASKSQLKIFSLSTFLAWVGSTSLDAMRFIKSRSVIAPGVKLIITFSMSSAVTALPNVWSNCPETKTRQEE